MDIKDLNKTQIVLLCFLVAFVSSIATGITVVRLMTEQIALSSPQPVNRIIRQTIEKVVSPKEDTTIPVVVSEEALLVSAIETVSPYVVSIKRTTLEGESKTILGTVIENNTVIIDVIHTVENASYGMEIGETPVPVTLSHVSDGIAYLTFTPSVSTETAFSKKPVSLAKTMPKSGQTVFGFDGLPLTVMRGIVSRITPATENNTATMITTLVGRSLFSGTPIVDTAGVIVGIGLVSEGEIKVISSADVLAGMKK